MLQRFDQENIELIIDTETGESFSSIRGMSRMLGISDAALRKYITANQIDLKIAQIPTTTGLKTANLINEDQMLDLISKYNPTLIIQFAKVGLRAYLHQLAGYHINSTTIAPQPPQTYIEALKALVVAEEEKARLVQENLQLKETVDELFEYSSIIRIAKYNMIRETAFNWRILKKTSLELGLEIKRVPCPRFEFKNLYPHQAWEICYPDAALPDGELILTIPEIKTACILQPELNLIYPE